MIEEQSNRRSPAIRAVGSAGADAACPLLEGTRVVSAVARNRAPVNNENPSTTKGHRLRAEMPSPNSWQWDEPHHGLKSARKSVKPQGSHVADSCVGSTRHGNAAVSQRIVFLLRSNDAFVVLLSGQIVFLVMS